MNIHALALASLSLVAAADVCVSSAPPGAVNDPILSSVAAVQPPLSVLNSLVVNWQSSDGLMGALAIQQSYYPLYSAVISLQSAVSVPPAIQPNDAGVYLNSLNNLVADISTLIGNLNAKANAFNGVGAGQIVVGDLTSLAGPASIIEASLFAGLPTNVPCVFQASAASIGSAFAAAFSSAAATFSISSGIPVFPTGPSACATYCTPTTSSPPVVTSNPPPSSSPPVVTSNPPPSSSPPVVTSNPPPTSTAPPVTSSTKVTSTAPPSSQAPSSVASTTKTTATTPTSTPTGAVQSLIDDINSLTGAINNVDTLVKKFKHGWFTDLIPLIKLQNAAVDLGSQIQALTKSFNSTAQLSPADTLKIATPFTNLIPPLKQVLSDIGAKKPEFDKAFLDTFSAAGLIKGQLVHLNQVTGALIAQIKLSIYPGFLGVVTPLETQVNDAFNEQINGVYKNVPSIYIPFKLFG